MDAFAWGVIGAVSGVVGAAAAIVFGLIPLLRERQERKAIQPARPARSYLPEPGISRYRYCQRCGYEFAGATVKQYCTYKSACDRRLREPGYRVPKGRTQNMEIRKATLAAGPESGPQ